MKVNLKNLTYVILAAGALAPSFVGAEETGSSTLGDATLSLDDNFHRGRFESSLSGGPMFSPIGSPQSRPTVNYAVGSLQLGYMLTEPPAGGGFLRGNLELSLEGFGDAIWKGQGNYIAGETLWIRYNFLPRDWCVVPYAQAGAGFVLTDTDRYLVGENFNFNLDLALGARYFIAPRWAVNLEYRFQHISNANLGPKNVGINAQGPILGVSWFF
jgi:opacity protein-like surface antigen